MPGSHQRFLAFSLRRIASWSVVALFALEGVLGLTTGAAGVWGLINIGVAVWLASSELQNHHDDCFNGRGKKSVAGIRKRFTPPRRSQTIVRLNLEGARIT